jgi:hypothetical protein
MFLNEWFTMFFKGQAIQELTDHEQGGTMIF